MKSLKEILISLEGLSDIELFVIDLFCGKLRLKKLNTVNHEYRTNRR